MTEAAIADFLRRLGTTGAVVTIAHRPSTGIDADPIVVMAEGRVRARGVHPELLASDGLCREPAEALRIGDAAEIP